MLQVASTVLIVKCREPSDSIPGYYSLDAVPKPARSHPKSIKQGVKCPHLRTDSSQDVNPESPSSNASIERSGHRLSVAFYSLRAFHLNKRQALELQPLVFQARLVALQIPCTFS